MKTRATLSSRRSQRGVSLFVVLMILLLSLLLVLGSLRLANFNEGVVGNQSDSQRAYAAAEALLEAAQRDVRANGRMCAAAPCRFPRDLADYSQMVANYESGGDMNRCGDGSSPNLPRGVCLSNNPNGAPYAIASIMNGGVQVLGTAASFTQFAPGTAGTGGDAVSLGLNAARGQYWIEVYYYNTSSGAMASTANVQAPDDSYPFVFRITTRATGLKPGTERILRTYYTPWPRLPV